MKERMVALRPHTPMHIRGAGHIKLTPANQLLATEQMEKKWSLH
jgi:hypothetical protein